MSLNSPQPGVAPVTILDLKFRRDFPSGLRHVKNALLQNKTYFAMLVGITFFEGITGAYNLKIPFLQLVDELVTWWVGCSVLWLAYAEYKPDYIKPEAKGAKLVEPRVVSTSFTYGLFTLLYSLLFILPGIWFATRASVAAVVACVEGSTATVAIKRSQELTKGKFWLTFQYLVGKTFLVWLVMLIVYIVIEFALAAILRVDADKIPPLLDGLIQGTYSFGVSIFQLSVLPIMVRLYIFLCQDATVQVSPTVSAGTPYQPQNAPSDSKLSPRWNKD